MTKALMHDSLLTRVAERLGSISATNDHLLLTRWRVLGLCQYLLGSPDGEAEQLSVEALEVFALYGADASTDEALLRASKALARTAPRLGESVLPSIAPAKREEVLTRLRAFENLGSEIIPRALHALPALRDRLRQPPASAMLAGIRHRLELLAGLIGNAGARSTDERCKAAAAILYVEEMHDAIHDTLGHIGLLDDDFALRVVLDELGEQTEEKRLHWTERISALWDDLPFLRGVQLRKGEGPVVTTWLDRINSYISYSHALDRHAKPLVLVQPSVACSPLHSIVSLIGLLVLERLTSSARLIRSLHEGQIYEIDGMFYARFDGISGPPMPGWLRLCFRDCTLFWPPNVAERMIAVPERHLSSARAFLVHMRSATAEPVQRFFDWDEAIGAAAISSRILLVSSRQRALELFAGVSSNGVGLLESGLVRFSGLTPSMDAPQSGLVLVVPNLTVARQLIALGVDAYAIVVDEYERLHHGRHDLPFLLRSASPSPVITWSSIGYCPADPPSWLPEHRRLEVSTEDLSSILELDDEVEGTVAPSFASLWEAATGVRVTKVRADLSSEEQRLLDAIDVFLKTIRQLPGLLEYWRYHLVSSAAMLRSLAIGTPSYWSDVREVAASWKMAFDEQWATLRPRIAEGLEPLAASLRRILEALQGISAERNTKADALLGFLAEAPDEHWHLVCDRPEQVRVAGQLARKAGVRGFEPTLLRGLGVCCACIVVGWQNSSFGRKLRAHTPRRLFALVSETEGLKWDEVTRHARERNGESLLEAVGHQRSSDARPPVPIGIEPNAPEVVRSAEPNGESEQPLAPCVFVWVAGEPEGKVLARDARVLMEMGDQAKEERAHRIRPDDRVILSPGSARWSPADEFTQVVVEAIEASHPELVRDVKEWRRALQRLREARQWSLETLAARLKGVGVIRELQTLDGWLRLDRAAPIGPLHIHKELEAIWKLVEGVHTQRRAADVTEACTRLRSLRAAAGRTILKRWKGGAAEVNVEGPWLERLQQEVQVHEVSAVTFGQVPRAMLGWWITPELAEEFEEPGTPSMQDDSQDVVSEDH